MFSSTNVPSSQETRPCEVLDYGFLTSPELCNARNILLWPLSKHSSSLEPVGVVTLDLYCFALSSLEKMLRHRHICPDARSLPANPAAVPALFCYASVKP
jgi:hypothetical protein